MSDADPISAAYDEHEAEREPSDAEKAADVVTAIVSVAPGWGVELPALANLYREQMDKCHAASVACAARDAGQPHDEAAIGHGHSACQLLRAAASAQGFSVEAWPRHPEAITPEQSERLTSVLMGATGRGLEHELRRQRKAHPHGVSVRTQGPPATAAERAAGVVDNRFDEHGRSTSAYMAANAASESAAASVIRAGLERERRAGPADRRSPNTPEPPPKPGTGVAVWELVMADMRERDETGARKYGQRLQPHDGRNTLVDAYQETLDQAVYLRKEIEERRGEVSIRDEVRRLLELLEADDVSGGPAIRGELGECVAGLRRTLGMSPPYVLGVDEAVDEPRPEDDAMALDEAAEARRPRPVEILSRPDGTVVAAGDFDGAMAPIIEWAQRNGVAPGQRWRRKGHEGIHGMPWRIVSVTDTPAIGHPNPEPPGIGVGLQGPGPCRGHEVVDGADFLDGWERVS